MTGSLKVIAGPPGTGKTTRLAEGVDKAACKVGEDRILICSLTNAAANEIAGRVSLPERNVGTLHAMCRRVLEKMPLATSKEVIGSWNERYPAWRISPTGTAATSADDPLAEMGGAADGGDRQLEDSSILRHLRRPKVLWPRHLVEFDAAWRRWKDDEGAIDFTDMIELVADRRLPPPGDPALLVVDEAQDLSPLETEVVRLWSGHASSTVAAGDADQAIFGWRGSVPILFREGEVPEEHFKVLEQSRRVPVAAHREAMKVISACSDRRPIVYRPTDEPGTLETSAPPFSAPQYLVDRAVQHVKDPSLGSCMFIAPCAFTLEPLIRELRLHGVPFHNPYKPSQGRWNPLGVRKGTTSVARILGFTAVIRERRPWTPEEFRAWAGGLQAQAVWKRGVKTQIEHPDFQPPPTAGALRHLLRNPEHAEAILAGDLSWYQAHAQASLKERLAYPLAVASRWGVGTLDHKPNVVVGTIHSIKGGEAETVIVAPDLSPKGVMTRNEDPDSIRRLMYVAMTRTRRDLVLCQPSRPRLSATMW